MRVPPAWVPFHLKILGLGVDKGPGSIPRLGPPIGGPDPAAVRHAAAPDKERTVKGPSAKLTKAQAVHSNLPGSVAVKFRP
jgi:hypothetical protein